MAENRDNLLGKSGQRGAVSRSALRGCRVEKAGGADRQAREHREDLLRRIRERSEQHGERGPEQEDRDA